MRQAGRNDPCPCGSGKKYKKCCEAKDTAPRKLKGVQIPTGLGTGQAMNSLFSRNVTPINQQVPPPVIKPDQKKAEE